jgi:hypothetical protein
MSARYADEQLVLLEDEIGRLMKKAEEADSTALQDGLSIPEEIARRRDRQDKIRAAKALMEQRARERLERENAEYKQKMAQREAKEKESGKKPRGRTPKAPEEGIREQDQVNFTDPESRIMKMGGGEHFEQCYNAQAAVDIQSRLIVGERLSNAVNDKQQLAPNLEAISPVITKVEAVLVDNGYYSQEAIQAVEAPEDGARGPVVYAATGRGSHRVKLEDLEKQAPPPEPGVGATMREIMDHRLQSRPGKELYKQRKQTVEPVFGIIKEAMGFRRFLLRGLQKVSLEWTLVCLSYNLKRLFHMNTKLQMA